MLYDRVKKKAELDCTASVTGMLNKLKLSRSGYYDYLKRKPCKQKIRKEKPAAKIKKIHKESREIYGAPKIAKILHKEGNKVSEKYVGNIMREHGIKAHYIKPYTVTTKDCDFSNRLKKYPEKGF